ncbi:MAG: hypothetical protein ACQEUK_03280 [Pseudomonadota bacterium]
MSEFKIFLFYKEIVEKRKKRSAFNQKCVLEEFYKISKSLLLDQAYVSPMEEVCILINELKKSKDLITADALSLSAYTRLNGDLLSFIDDELNSLFLESVFKTSLVNLISVLRNPRSGFIEKENRDFFTLNTPELIESFYESSKKISGKYSLSKRSTENIKSILIYVDDISPIKNQTGTKLFLDYCFALSNRKDIEKVTLLISQGNSLSMKSGVSGYTFRCNRLNVQESFNKNYATDCYIDVLRLNDEIKQDDDFLYNSFKCVQELDPDVVLFFDYKPSILLAAITNVFPSVYVPIQVGLAPFIKPTIECVMSHDNRLVKKIKPINYYHKIDRQISFPLVEDDDFEPQSSFSSKSNEKIRIITAAFDLDKRVSQERLFVFLKGVSDILNRDSRVFYTILGVSEEDGLRMFQRFNLGSKVDLNRVLFKKNEPRFVSEIKRNDIFIMPYHKGGGRAVRTAIEQGLAVLTLDNNDGNLYLSDKYIFNDEASLFNRLSKIISDNKEFKNCVKDCQAYYNSIDNDALVDNVLLAFDKARSFHQSKKLLVIGDSHSTYLSCAEFFEDSQVFFNPVFGATGSGLSNKNSLTNSDDVFRRSVFSIRPDKLMISIGEVDVGFLAWKKRNIDNENIFYRMSKALENIVSYTLELASKVEFVAVLSVPLPTVFLDISDEKPIYNGKGQRESVYATYQERFTATQLFNLQLDYAFSKHENVLFVNLDKDVCDIKGDLKDGLIKKDVLDHHYNPNVFCNIVCKNDDFNFFLRS